MSLWQWLAERVSPFIDTHRLTFLENRMTKIDDALAELDDVTDLIAERLDLLVSNASNLDADTATKIHAQADHLRALAKDPENVSPVEVPQTPSPVEVPGTQAGADTGPQTGVQGIAGIGRN